MLFIVSDANTDGYSEKYFDVGKSGAGLFFSTNNAIAQMMGDMTGGMMHPDGMMCMGHGMMFRGMMW
jgi:hypothetical protein